MTDRQKETEIAAMPRHPVVEQIERAAATTGVVIAGIGAEQWKLPTPCAEWDVTALVNHLVGGIGRYVGQLTGTDPGKAPGGDWLGDDPVAAYRAAAAADLAAWRRPGALDRTLAVAIGELPGEFAATVHLTELAVHGADLAVATGQENLLDPELLAGLLAAIRELGVEPYRVPGVFGPEALVPEDAPVHLRLLAHLGRTVAV
ncbi:TIGR03086 family metal-binding protein [Kitasatospora sp. NPDC096077]|uniref:TIGR03086 family metal-binding protein n=1 Tax=Kitasatospora sp. NPDC096077 TaxID=3155544 RepID=UPI0033279A97